MGHGVRFNDHASADEDGDDDDDDRSLAYVELSANGSTRTITWLEPSPEFLSVVGASVIDENAKAVIREM